MKIHYTLDDSAARLPLTIRSADGVWDRAAELRSTPGIHLVELITQHVLNTGATVLDELAHYFDAAAASESDPYALATCYANRTMLEDLLDDLRDTRPGLIALHEVAELFPMTYTQDIQFMIALTAVGYPAFGYVRTYKDSEGEQYHGMVVNLAQARPHLEQMLGYYLQDILINVIRHGFFNHEGFLLVYAEYCENIERVPETFAERLKDTLLSRGIAWYLSYRHNLRFYDESLGLDENKLSAHVERYNTLMTDTRRKKSADESAFDAWLQQREPNDTSIDVVGYHAARTVATTYGDDGLRQAIDQGPDHFIDLYNSLGKFQLKTSARR
jgi:hypothetical protein